MNIEKLRRLRDHLASLPEPKRFRMQDFLEDDRSCGTVGCIAGHALILEHPGRSADWVRKEVGGSIREGAREALGLTPWKAENLFMPNTHELEPSVYLHQITPRQAARVIDLMIEERDINLGTWRRALS